MQRNHQHFKMRQVPIHSKTFRKGCLVLAALTGILFLAFLAIAYTPQQGIQLFLFLT
jgi:hypothetical protein